MQKEFFDWIRSQFCILCGGFDDWNGVDSVPLNTVSHIKTRGSGGADLDNCVPMCTKCHRVFEEWPWSKKENYLTHAKLMSDRFFRERYYYLTNPRLMFNNEDN